MQKDYTENSKRANALGIALSLYILLQLVTSALIFSFAGSIRDIVSLVFKVIRFGVPTVVYFKITGYEPKRKEKPIQKNAVGALEFLFAFSFISVAVNTVGGMTEKAMSVFGMQVPESTVSANAGEFVFMFLGSVLLAAITEEILFRYVVMHALEGCGGTAKVLVSAALFSIMHCNFLQIPYAFAAGIVISAFYLRTGSIIYAVMLHFSSNLFTFVFEALRTFGDAEKVSFASNIAYIVLSVTAICGAVYFILSEKKNGPARSDEPKTEIKSFLNAGTAIYAVSALLIAILNII